MSTERVHPPKTPLSERGLGEKLFSKIHLSAQELLTIIEVFVSTPNHVPHARG